MQYAQLMAITFRQLQKFARLKQVRGVLRAARQLRLRHRVRLVDEQSAWSHRLHHLRKYSPLQIEERHHHLETCLELGLRSFEASEIIYCKVNLGREWSSILPRLFNSGLGDINEHDLPTLFCQPDRVPSGSSREIKRSPSARKQRPNVFGKRLRQEWIGSHRYRCAGRFAIFLVPALPFSVGISIRIGRSRERHV